MFYKLISKLLIMIVEKVVKLIVDRIIDWSEYNSAKKKIEKSNEDYQNAKTREERSNIANNTP